VERQKKKKLDKDRRERVFVSLIEKCQGSLSNGINSGISSDDLSFCS
jgi:hypothetical protein